MPTVLDLLGMPPAEGWQAQSVVPLMTGAVRELGLDAYAEAVYPRYHYGWSDLRSLTPGRYKFIEAPRPELYDLEQDPRRDDATSTTSGRRSPTRWPRRLRVDGDRRRRGRRRRPRDVDPDARARLAALGYVGTFVATAGTDRRGPPIRRTRSGSSTWSSARASISTTTTTRRRRVEDAS